MKHHRSEKVGKSRRWSLSDWRGLALGLVIIGAILGGISGLRYFFGVPEHVAETMVGTRHVPSTPSGLSGDQLGMFMGISIAMAGGAALLCLKVAGRLARAKDK